MTTDLITRLEKRRDGIGDFLAGTTCEQDQRHLDAGTTERDYWHYGYAVALNDVIALLRARETPPDQESE